MTPPGRGLFGPEGHGWKDLITKNCYTQNVKAIGFREEDFLCFPM